MQEPEFPSLSDDEIAGIEAGWEEHFFTLSGDEVETLDAAADALDAVWELDASRGLVDALGGAEYHRVSLAPRLRAIAERAHVATMKRQNAS